MAKNVDSSAFRKFDVDQFNDDFKEDENALEIQSPGCNGNALLDEQEFTKLLKQGNALDAIKYVINVFSLAYKNPLTRESLFTSMQFALSSVKTNDVDKVVEALSLDELDVLMKYVYKAFEQPGAANCGNLLVWHDRIFNKAGVGSIVRVLTDKKRV